MKSSLLLQLSCLWPAYCSRRTPLEGSRSTPTNPLDPPDIIEMGQILDLRSGKSVEDIGCIPTDTYTYTGNASKTENGFTCQKWSADSHHNHTYNGIGEHNYCGNPVGPRLFCYTTDPTKRFDYCDVPHCPPSSAHDIGCLPTDGTAYTGRANTTVSGRVCQSWANNTPHQHKNTDVGQHNYCRQPDHRSQKTTGVLRRS